MKQGNYIKRRGALEPIRNRKTGQNFPKTEKPEEESEKTPRIMIKLQISDFQSLNP